MCTHTHTHARTHTHTCAQHTHTCAQHTRMRAHTHTYWERGPHINTKYYNTRNTCTYPTLWYVWATTLSVYKHTPTLYTWQPLRGDRLSHSAETENSCHTLHNDLTWGGVSSKTCPTVQLNHRPQQMPTDCNQTSVSLLAHYCWHYCWPKLSHVDISTTEHKGKLHKA